MKCIDKIFFSEIVVFITFYIVFIFFIKKINLFFKSYNFFNICITRNLILDLLHIWKYYLDLNFKFLIFILSFFLF